MNKKDLNPESLPVAVEKRSSHIIGLPPPNAQSSATTQVETLISEIVPEGNQHEVVDELKRTVLVGHTKPRVRPHKRMRKKKIRSEAPPHRGKKRMTSAEKREAGLVRLKKKNKTFKMFIPIHKVWKQYAEELLGAPQFLKRLSEGLQSPKTVEVVQSKLKKLEFFGSIIKVSRSRCSEYIGLQGIVIQETKNTFSIITTDDQVKVIPKLFTEFCFVFKNFGFTILGNHLHQRPVDKAKQNFKKHCLWL